MTKSTDKADRGFNLDDAVELLSYVFTEAGTRAKVRDTRYRELTDRYEEFVSKQ